MCDYSQEGVDSRPARKGEELQIRRLPDAPCSPGFVSPGEPDRLVCLLPGTTLVVRQANPNDQEEFRIAPGAEIKFVQQDVPSGTSAHRDAIQFPGVPEPVVLGRLKNGFTVSVLMLPEDLEKEVALPAPALEETQQEEEPVLVLV